MTDTKDNQIKKEPKVKNSTTENQRNDEKNVNDTQIANIKSKSIVAKAKVMKSPVINTKVSAKRCVISPDECPKGASADVTDGGQEVVAELEIPIQKSTNEPTSPNNNLQPNIENQMNDALKAVAGTPDLFPTEPIQNIPIQQIDQVSLDQKQAVPKGFAEILIDEITVNTAETGETSMQDPPKLEDSNDESKDQRLILLSEFKDETKIVHKPEKVAIVTKEDNVLTESNSEFSSPNKVKELNDADKTEKKKNGSSLNPIQTVEKNQNKRTKGTMKKKQKGGERTELTPSKQPPDPERGIPDQLLTPENPGPCAGSSLPIDNSTNTANPGSDSPPIEVAGVPLLYGNGNGKIEAQQPLSGIVSSHPVDFSTPPNFDTKSKDASRVERINDAIAKLVEELKRYLELKTLQDCLTHFYLFPNERTDVIKHYQNLILIPELEKLKEGKSNGWFISRQESNFETRFKNFFIENGRNASKKTIAETYYQDDSGNYLIKRDP